MRVYKSGYSGYCKRRPEVDGEGGILLCGNSYSRVNLRGSCNGKITAGGVSLVSSTNSTRLVWNIWSEFKEIGGEELFYIRFRMPYSSRVILIMNKNNFVSSIDSFRLYHRNELLLGEGRTIWRNRRCTIYNNGNRELVGGEEYLIIGNIPIDNSLQFRISRPSN